MEIGGGDAVFCLLIFRSLREQKLDSISGKLICKLSVQKTWIMPLKRIVFRCSCRWEAIFKMFGLGGLISRRIISIAHNGRGSESASFGRFLFTCILVEIYEVASGETRVTSGRTKWGGWCVCRRHTKSTDLSWTPISGPNCIVDFRFTTQLIKNHTQRYTVRGIKTHYLNSWLECGCHRGTRETLWRIPQGVSRVYILIAP